LQSNNSNNSSESVNKTVSSWSKFITYMNYVFFYIRFVFIYLLSALLEIMGISSFSPAVLLVFGIGLTVVIIYFIVGNENDDKSEYLLSRLNLDDDLKINSDNEATSSLSLKFYLATEYLFDISWMFGFSRQFILTYYTQSHAIAFLSSYQLLIFLGAAWLSILLLSIKYNELSGRITRQNKIFAIIDRAKLDDNIFCQDKPEFNNRLLLSLKYIAISLLLFVGFQFYLSGSFSIVNPYSISLCLLTGLTTTSLSYVFLGHKSGYWSAVWVGFMTLSATMGVIFLGKVAFMAVLGNVVSDFYYARGVGIFIGCAIGVGIIYGQILQHFSNCNYKISAIEDAIEANKIKDIDTIKKTIPREHTDKDQDAALSGGNRLVTPVFMHK
jgi:hypothetical protein